MEEFKSFKLGKTGIIVIVISAVIVALFVAMLYVIGKKQQELNSLKDVNNDVKHVNKAAGTSKNVNEKKKYTFTDLQTLFTDYRAGKLGSVEAVELSGLSTGTFYRKLKEYETAE